MFYLFRSSRIIYPFNYMAIFLSLIGVFYWLHFTLIDQLFLENFFGGEALLVDLLFGFPIVILFGLVIYAMAYWVIKVALILFAPFLLERIDSCLYDDQLDTDVAKEFGDNYWQKKKDSDQQTEFSEKDKK